jgi:2-oxoglutarate/2-oxoacid ferredoxin oxidoreductase subunit beta
MAPLTGCALAEVGEVGEEALVVHDAKCADPSYATALARLAEDPSAPTPIGVLRDVKRPVYGAGRQRKLAPAHAQASLADVDRLLRSGDTWTVSS